jgi:Kef-type K+ transport system membrane component KefB
MTSVAEILLLIGGLFVAGLVADLIARRTPIPRVTLLVLLGVAAGPVGLDLLAGADSWSPVVSQVALAMVAFLLGGQLHRGELRGHGRAVLLGSLILVVVTASFVGAGLILLGFAPEVALPLAAIGTSTAPAAVADVVRQVRARGPFSRVLLGVVAMDDAWGLVLFSLTLAVAVGLGSSAGAEHVLLEGVGELLGSVVLGGALGFAMAAVTGRLHPGEPTQVEALGGVFLCAGAALALGCSALLAAMVMGVVVTNRGSHHRRPFRAIEGIEWPFMILFFVLSGASLRLEELAGAGGLVLALVVLRVAGRIVGGVLAAQAGRLEGASGRWLGVALLPQAGVALGMAIAAARELPASGATILTAVVATTVVFELTGPFFTRRALNATGEAREGTSEGAASGRVRGALTSHGRGKRRRGARPPT